MIDLQPKPTLLLLDWSPKALILKLRGLWVLLPLLLAFGASSCGSGSKGCKDAPDLPAKLPTVNIQRLDESFWKTDTTKYAVSQWLAAPEVQPFIKRYRQEVPEMSDEDWLQYITNMRKDRFLDTMRQEVAEHMGTLNDLELDYAKAFAYLQYYYPKAPVPTVMAFVTGYSFDVSPADSSLIMLGLESFLGGKGRYVPPMMPQYMLRRMKRNTIVPLTMLAISNRYNKRDMLDASLAADIIHWGKTYYFMEKMLPCTPDSIIIGYTPAEMDFVERNEKLIYSKFVNDKLFFITNHLEKRRYAEERPIIPEISEKCPGRVGRYLGWQMVRAYAAKTGKDLPAIMAEQNGLMIFQQSGYKP